MFNNKQFWLFGNAVTIVLHLVGIAFYLAQGFDSWIAQLWIIIVAIHVLEIPMALVAVQNRGIAAGVTAIKTLVFGFTWWVPARRGLYAG